ncbi:MAG: hypothetical protein GX297_10295 [Treponema sp.]|nr:hypothetical protein [Treponema sp.]
MAGKKLILSLILFINIFSFIFADVVETSAEKIIENNEELTQFEERREKISFGLDSEIEELITNIIKDEDFEYGGDLFALFVSTRNQNLKAKIFDYFIAAKDPLLKDYALNVLKDPFDERKSIVNKVFEYVGVLKIQEARDSVINLLLEEDGKYVESAAKIVGKVGILEDAAKISKLLDFGVPAETKLLLIRALGELNAVDSVETLIALAKDSSETPSIRMAAAESLGDINNFEATNALVALYEDTDANVRTSVVKALAKKTDENSKAVILNAVKDNFYKVRLAALQSIIDQQLEEASSVVLYRAKNDSENVVKHKSYEALSAIHSAEGIWYLLNLVEDKKKTETDRAKAASVLLKYNFDSTIEPIKSVARETLNDKKQIKLRYALGKEFAKYTNVAIEDICAAYMLSDDVATKGTALDMFEKNNFSSLRALVEIMSIDEKEGANQKKAKNVLDRIERSGTPSTESVSEN